MFLAFEVKSVAVIVPVIISAIERGSDIRIRIDSTVYFQKL